MDEVRHAHIKALPRVVFCPASVGHGHHRRVTEKTGKVRQIRGVCVGPRVWEQEGLSLSGIEVVRGRRRKTDD